MVSLANRVFHTRWRTRTRVSLNISICTFANWVLRRWNINSSKEHKRQYTYIYCMIQIFTISISRRAAVWQSGSVAQTELNLSVSQWSANVHTINCCRLFSHVSLDCSTVECRRLYCFARYLRDAFKFSEKDKTPTCAHTASANICVWNVYLIFIVIMHVNGRKGGHWPVATGHCENNLFIVGVSFAASGRTHSEGVMAIYASGCEFFYSFRKIRFNVWYFV